jgi:hypothetical protein
VGSSSRHHGTRIDADSTRHYGTRIDADSTRHYGTRIDADLTRHYGTRIDADSTDLLVTSEEMCVAPARRATGRAARAWLHQAAGRLIRDDPR